MKKLLLILIILSPLLTTAQDESTIIEPFFGMQGSLKKVGAHAGILFNRFEATVSYDHPMSSTTRRKYLSLTGGYVLINRKFYVTSFTGIAHVYSRLEPDSKPDNPEINIPAHNAIIFGTEVGYSTGAGKIFIAGRYCEEAFITIGFKVFPLDLN